MKTRVSHFAETLRAMRAFWGMESFLLEGAENLYDSFKVGNPLAGDHDVRWNLPLPSREETVAYMARVQDRVIQRLDHDPDDRETYLYLLSVLHEDMHGEAFTYMRQTLEYPQPRLSISGENSTAFEIGGGPLRGDVEIPGGAFLLGASPDSPGKCEASFGRRRSQHA